MNVQQSGFFGSGVVLPNSASNTTTANPTTPSLRARQSSAASTSATPQATTAGTSSSAPSLGTGTPTSSSNGANGSSATTSTGAADATTFANAALNLLFNAFTHSVVNSSGSVTNTSAAASTSSGLVTPGGSGASGGSTTPGDVTTTADGVAVVSEGESLVINTTGGAQITVNFAAAGAGVMSQSNGSSDATTLSIGNMQVSVSGTLSPAAAQAVSNVLSQVDSLASQFFSGDVQDAFAAAANLSVDPSEIAGMNMSLLYTSNTYQTAATSNASAGTQNSLPTGDGISATASSASTSGNAGSASAATNGIDGSPGAATANATATNVSPQQAIITFLQQVMGKLGRNTNAAELQLPSSSKLQLLALAIPAYGQQIPGTQLAAATLNQMAA